MIIKQRQQNKQTKLGFLNSHDIYPAPLNMPVFELDPCQSSQNRHPNIKQNESSIESFNLLDMLQMSDNESIILENDLIGETSNPDVNSGGTCFKLFKTYFDGRITNLQNELSIGNDILKRKLKKDVAVKLEGEGNQIQYTFHCDILSDLARLQRNINPDDTASVNIVSRIILKIKKRNKLIRIADKSPGGWKTVREYESDDLASDSEDKKRQRSAENRAFVKLKSRKSENIHMLGTRHRLQFPDLPLQRLHLILHMVFKELDFWIKNLSNLNCKRSTSYSLPSVLFYSDARDVASGACTFGLGNAVFHISQTRHEFDMERAKDIFSSGLWAMLPNPVNQELVSLAQRLPEFCLHSKAENTVMLLPISI
ncbi:hypothetical protein KUTeg_006082 [Tegillarca granosa]|uniref:Uncharacterized protein n=1 Tax=Tegillarca granosa TaxID=220873 RepID=A0ABQ9FFF6_TEGGR|nr:hypothetical protein KUTeg_006082 [Tegillarca granosa]